MSGEQKNVRCKNINWQWFSRLAHAWDVLWYDIVSVDQIALGKCDCRTVILTIIFYRSLISESSVTGLGVYTWRWVYDNITHHSLCYLARVRPVVLCMGVPACPIGGQLDRQSKDEGYSLQSVIFLIFGIVNTHVSYWISGLYWHMSNINLIQIISYFCEIAKYACREIYERSFSNPQPRRRWKDDRDSGIQHDISVHFRYFLWYLIISFPANYWATLQVHFDFLR